ncbi:MAG: 5'/3'-nucleotidase SurE [Firmicutes bacterium]|nr:5'/3'-nucleotidase SurE [Bacillota bacterium]
MRPLKILLVNEQGCFHPGIVALAKELSGKHQVCIVGPLQSNEGMGHALTTGCPLRAEQFFVLNKVKIFGINGTPCDCVNLAIDKLLKSKPDLIISGIDNKTNRGETIYSSGVVSAAIAGTIQGIKSIAISAVIENTKRESSYVPVARVISKELKTIFENIRDEVTLNINFPAKFTFKKVQAARLTTGIVHNEYTEETNPFGKTFYWLKSPVTAYNLECLEQFGDIYWLKKNFITVTPLKYDLTDASVFATLEKSGIKL